MSTTLDQFIPQYLERKQCLKDLLVEGQPLLFVGAGVGANLFPVWKNLLRELLEEAGITLTSEQVLLSDPEKAQIVKDKDPAVYKRVVRRHFAAWQPTHERVLAPLERFNLRSIITTNYDDALLQRFQYHQFSTIVTNQLHVALLADSNKYIYHIHGAIRENEPPESDLNIILSQDEYDQYYKHTDVIPDFIKTAIGQYPTVFIGVSFGDKHVTDVLQKYTTQERLLVSNGTSPPSKERFALIPLEIENDEQQGRRILDFDYIDQKEEELQRLGITPVWFQRGSHYRGLSDLLEQWAKEAASVRQGIHEQRPVTP